MGLDRSIDITAEQRKAVLALLERHLPNTTVWVYGSRAKWTARPQSDLDMVVFATPEQASRVSNLREAFEESSLPFRVDLFVWDAVPEQFRKHIKRDHVVLVEKEELGTAVDGWVSLRLGEVCTKIGSGVTPRGGKEVYLKDGPCALIRSQNVYNNRFSHDGLAFISQQQAAELNNVEVFADDVLLNITGDSVARACQVAPDVLPARVNQHVAIIRPDPKKLSARFLRYFLVCSKIQAMLLSWAGSGGTRNALTKGMIESFDVQAPIDVPEQHAIAHILGTLDDKIELNRRMNETLEAMARALFKSWFVDFDPVRAKMKGRDTGLPQRLANLFPDRLVNSELGEIPEGWEATTLGEHVANFDSKRVPVSRTERAKKQGPFPYHGAAGVMDHVNNYLFDGIYLLIGEDGSVIRESGVAVTQYVWGKFWVNNHAHVLQGRGPVSTEQVYLYFCFEPIAPYVTGAVQPKLSQGRMNDMPFLFPGAAICKGFARAISPWFAMRRACSLESKTLTALRDALLPKLISSDIRVRHAEIQQLVGRP